MAFKSPNSIKNYAQSRRDDLYSLFYMLLYMSTGHQSFIFNCGREQVIKLKLKMSPAEVCKDAPFLISFAQHVYKLKFEDKPNYGLLKFEFIKNLLDRDLVPSLSYDWIS